MENAHGLLSPLNFFNTLSLKLALMTPIPLPCGRGDERLPRNVYNRSRLDNGFGFEQNHLFQIVIFNEGRMPLLVWNAKLETGVQSMDKQHQYWVLLMNNLYDAVQEKINKKIIDQTLTGMLNYTRIHFADEERLLFENGYPDYVNHKKLHDNFIKKLEELQKLVERGQQSDWLSVLEIIKLMSKWFKEHIQGDDQKYASFLKEKGVN